MMNATDLGQIKNKNTWNAKLTDIQRPRPPFIFLYPIPKNTTIRWANRLPGQLSPDEGEEWNEYLTNPH